MKKTFKAAFTMAEILISLTIIGVIAAITLPSLSGNMNERLLNTRRIALYSRLSQAFGLIDSISDVGKYDASGNLISNWEDTAALTFVTNKLTQGMKITNTCKSDAIKSCGFADVLTKADGASFSLPATFKALVNNNNLSTLETKPAAFITKNGESIVLYYNPDCMTKTGSANSYMNFVCINLIYDLNGIKGPNIMGKDLGVATVLYSSASDFVMPILSGVMGTAEAPDAAVACSESGNTLTTLEEMISVAVNNKLIYSTPLTGKYHTSTLVTVNTALGTGTSDWLVNVGEDSLTLGTNLRDEKYLCLKKMVD